jgi:hypothetical protein
MDYIVFFILGGIFGDVLIVAPFTDHRAADKRHAEKQFSIKSNEP